MVVHAFHIFLSYAIATRRPVHDVCVCIVGDLDLVPTTIFVQWAIFSLQGNLPRRWDCGVAELGHNFVLILTV